MATGRKMIKSNKMENFDRENSDKLLKIHQYFPLNLVPYGINIVDLDGILAITIIKHPQSFYAYNKL